MKDKSAMNTEVPDNAAELFEGILFKNGVPQAPLQITRQAILKEIADYPVGAAATQIFDRLKSEEIAHVPSNAFVAAESLGIIGCVSATSDLSTNRLHMSGFGE
jgi:hypothetical protein